MKTLVKTFQPKIKSSSFVPISCHDAEVKMTMEIADAKEILFTAVASIGKVVSEAQ